MLLMRDTARSAYAQLLQRSDTRVPPQQAHESPFQGVGCNQRRLSQTRPAAGSNYPGRSLRSVCQQQRERQILTMSLEGSPLAQEACSPSRPGLTFGCKRDATAFRRTTFKALWEVSASSIRPRDELFIRSRVRKAGQISRTVLANRTLVLSGLTKETG
jgi:hypothetical protein